jgi:hypothetical protein
MTTVFHRLLGGKNIKDELKRLSFDFIDLKNDSALDENIDKIKINNDLVQQFDDSINLAHLLKTFPDFNPINTGKKISNGKRLTAYRELLTIIFANLWKQVDSIKNEKNIYIKTVRANVLLKSMEKNIKGLPEIKKHQKDYDFIKNDLDNIINQTKDILRKFREFTQQFENLKKQGDLNELENLKFNVQSLETLSGDQYSKIKELYGLAVNVFSEEFKNLEPQKNKLIEDIRVEITKLQNNEEQERKNQEQARIKQSREDQAREEQAKMEAEQAKMEQEILSAKAQRQRQEQEDQRRLAQEQEEAERQRRLAQEQEVERQRLAAELAARTNKVKGITPNDNLVGMDLLLAQYLLSHNHRRRSRIRKKSTRRNSRRTNKSTRRKQRKSSRRTKK